MSKVYIAGKITGDCESREIAEQFSHEERQRRSFGYREKFERAAAQLRREGHVVLNPWPTEERQRARVARTAAVLPEGLSRGEYMRICFAMIDVADRVVLLPDYKDSPGARLEKEYCRYIGKRMVEL